MNEKKRNPRKANSGEKKSNINDIHRMAVCSDLRKNILLNLYECKKPLANLRDGMKITSTTAIHALRDLEKCSLTFQDKNKNYSLTNIGMIVATKLLDFNNAAEVLREHEKFWLEHDISGIPPDLMEKIGWLRNSKLMGTNELNIINPHNTYLSLIKNARWIKGVTPIFSSDYTDLYKGLVEMNIRVQIVVTVAVMKKLTEDIGLNILKNLIDNYDLEIFVTNENPRVAFTATDSVLSFGLFNNNRVYDITQDLISTDKMGIRWGCELFEYYLGKAKRYKI